jgi:hypothetical protein
VRSRSLVVSIGGEVILRDREGIFSVERIVIGEIGYILVARNDDRMLLAVKAFSRALIKAVVHSTRGTCRVSKRKRGSNSRANIRFRGLNRPTSSGCDLCDVCGGRQARSIFTSKQKAINRAAR